ncbi:Anti-sigma F factor antagonist (spoIIAA-2) [Fulvivirga imtechensis AK7]|uniref:Anti-sigma factor antagonist n=1 Tax=Fulvivirga imtechensis AK7 TaxID=1237149 RepID=L8JUM7_9BACT|nr:STAS domain-containing protein [Fulvivirga imtechensis]ELR70997.1 Anti-sigma F factor antagonist (spoIIAA-2) [Fulvivirga imtechensis AK7]
MVDIKRIKEGEYEVIAIKGEVDASSSIELDSAISDAINDGTKKLLVDCTSLEYISSAGLGVFMSYIEEFKKNNVNLVIFGLNDKVANVFGILGLDQLLKIEGTKMEAKALLG